MSSAPLTPKQRVLLAHGPNVSVVSWKPPCGDYINAIELAYQSLNNSEAEELRADIYRVLRQPHHPKSYLSKDEQKVLKHLRADKDHIILTTDKGVELVVMDRQDHIKKARNLLEDTNTYIPSQTDPTNEHKANLINILKNIKVTAQIIDNIYRRMFPTGASYPKFMGWQNSLESIPLSPIVSSTGSVIYGLAIELARSLKPHVGKTIHHVNNTKEVVDEVKNTKLEEEECIISYDVTALFTAVPVSSAIDIIRNRLEQDTKLPNITIMSPRNITELLEFCLNNTYFLFQEQFFEQTKGAAMGLSVRPIVANIYMEVFEQRAITTALNPPRIWKRYVNDTFVIQHQSQ